MLEFLPLNHPDCTATSIQEHCNRIWKQLVEAILTHNASDLFFANQGIQIRIGGEISAVFSQNCLPPELYNGLLDRLQQDCITLSPNATKEFATTIEGMRFRVSLFHAHEGLSAALRPLSDKIESPQALGLSEEIVQKVLNYESGLILVTGPTGAGKTTTISSLIEQINLTHRHVIITIEDPIEILFQSKRSCIYQREIGRYCESFPLGLRAALRQSPNTIFIGEIRDAETVETALRAAESGHLILATLHTRDVVETINRFLDMAASDRKSEMRSVLANTLQMVISQRLLRTKKGTRVACREILTSNMAVRNYIRESKEFHLPNVMLQGRAEGMIHWNRAVESLKEVITTQEYNRHYRRS